MSLFATEFHRGFRGFTFTYTKNYLFFFSFFSCFFFSGFYFGIFLFFPFLSLFFFFLSFSLVVLRLPFPDKGKEKKKYKGKRNKKRKKKRGGKIKRKEKGKKKSDEIYLQTISVLAKPLFVWFQTAPPTPPAQHEPRGIHV